MSRNAILVGTSDMADFAAWWERQRPSWLILYCQSGEATLSLLFNRYAFRPGMMTIVQPDMFPAVAERTADFRVFYCLLDRDFADETAYVLPNEFYSALYAKPLLAVDTKLDLWMQMIAQIHADTANPYADELLRETIYGLFLMYYHLWQQQYGDLPPDREKTQAETIAVKFYNLVFDHFREHRDIAYYADRLCITSGYLATVIRQVCREAPKEAINRLVVLEIKNLLETTAMTAEQIAQTLHFPDTSYMCRFFRKQTGRSMSEYRRGG